MADLKFVDQHNMVACLEKTEENAEFHQIVDFLSSCSITYALTVSPTLYAYYIVQFWNTATSKTVNSVKQIHAIVDGKAMVILESSVRSDLLFNDEDGIAYLTNDEIFENLALMGYEQLSTKLTFQKVSHELHTEAHFEQILPSPSTYQRKQRKTQKHKRAKKATELPKTSVPLDHGADEAVYKEGVTVWKGLSLLMLGDSPRRQETMGVLLLRLDNVPNTPHDSPLSGGYTPGSDEGRMELIQELMETCTSLTKRVLALEEAKTAQDRVITRLKLRVKRLEKKRKARTPQPMKRRLFKGRVESSDDDLDEEDASKRISLNESDVFVALLAKSYDEIQARIDAEHELAVRLTHEEQEKYTIEERARLLAEFFERRKKQLAAERAEAIRNKPPTRTQKLYEREKNWIDDFKPIDDDSQQQAESTKKRPRADSEEESSKKHKLKEDNDVEIEELRDCMDVAQRDDVAIDVESLATKYSIVDWKTHILNENMMYYQIIRGDGSSKIFSEMLDDFDRQDVIDLHRLVNERYETTSPGEYDLLLWRDLKTLFEPNEEDEIWKNQQD
ncbi:hypothetical protein Tco_0097661 [Tanacetum coccineum]